MAAEKAGVSRLSLAEVEEYVSACCCDHSPPRVSELARRVGLSREYLGRTFTAQHGRLVCEYLKALQIARAKILLHATRVPVERVGYETAFGTPRSFYRTFRAMTGLTPAAYRRLPPDITKCQ